MKGSLQAYVFLWQMVATLITKDRLDHYGDILYWPRLDDKRVQVVVYLSLPEVF